MKVAHPGLCRHKRRVAKRAARRGVELPKSLMELRVLGSGKSFQLAFVGPKVRPVPGKFTKQKDAVAAGESLFGQTPRKLKAAAVA